jgi:hypothetical protein
VALPRDLMRTGGEGSGTASRRVRDRAASAGNTRVRAKHGRAGAWAARGEDAAGVGGRGYAGTLGLGELGRTV